MPNRLHIDLSGVKDLLAYYAELKQIPLSKVIRNAAKDFIQGAYDKAVTPLGEKIAKNPWALVPGRGKKAGKGVYINLDRQSPEDARRLELFRLRKPMRGFARSMFIPVMRELEFKKPKPSGAASFDRVQRGFSFYANRRSDPFKAQIEALRSARTSSGRREPFSHREICGTEDAPAIRLTVRQPSLSQYPQWESAAHSAGVRLAAARIAKDLLRIVKSTHPKNAVPPHEA